MDRRETERLLLAIRRAYAAGERVAVATVVRVRGSAYRREGTRMSFTRTHIQYALSGGCLNHPSPRPLFTWFGPEAIIVSYDLATTPHLGTVAALSTFASTPEDDAMTKGPRCSTRRRSRAGDTAFRRVGACWSMRPVIVGGLTDAGRARG